MAEYNEVILLGNLTRDPDPRTTSAGTRVPLAVHRRYRLNDELKDDICYIDISVLGRVGERSKSHLRDNYPGRAR